ncbi:MAG: insulinase family protein, partial [Pyrinomonadaceae bacterium]|nr:insulinase family protein [Sphingobacteriaceae bacterium]
NFAKNITPGISLSEVNGLAKKYITDANRDVLILAPEKDAATLPSEAVVNGWIDQAKKEKLTAYVDQVSNKPLLAKKPFAGKIINEKKIEEIGVTELTLSNGVKIVLKPTDFKNDEIIFTSFSPGGTSLYSDADYQSATFSSPIVTRGGVGEFNSIQLPKLLTGKRVGVNPYISERAEGINGSAAPKDLETALQLVYLHFTAPRKDAEMFQAMIGQQKGVLANRGNDPNSVFADTIAAVMGSYNIRRTGPSLAKLEQIKLDRAFEIYKERFADASDFTFTFVGSFKVEEIKPLLAQYLGALPAIKRVETAKDLGIIPPSGKVEKTVYKGQEPKATTRLVFTGDYIYNEDINNQLDALGEVLQIKLIERLREEESGVYSPRVQMTYSKFPRNRYSFTVSFGSSPENIDKLVAATLNEINKIKEKGALATDIEKFLAEEKRTTEIQLKQNGFWSAYLQGQYQNNESPTQVLSYLDSLKKLTPESLKEVANKYLSGDNMIKLVLLPANK